MGKILMTGAAGGVGTLLRPLLRERYGDVVLSDRVEVTDLQPGETFRPCDLTNPAEIEQCLEGVDRVLHFGGKSIEAPWDVILHNNIMGLFSLYEASRKAGVKRIVFASSVHAVGFYPRGQMITPDHRVRPDSRYGLSKVFGEGVAALYADKHALGTLSVRIGNVAPQPLDTRRLSIWVHPEDLLQLCEIGLEHPDIHNQVVFGMSDNQRGWWDNSTAHKLGYEPQHKSENHVAQAVANDGPQDPVGDQFQGGPFCGDDFDGEVAATLKG